MAMKEKAAKVEGRKIKKFSITIEDEELDFEIQEPTFDQIAAALSQLKPNGNLDMVGCGKVIWELCCVSYDTRIEDNNKALVSLCLDLTNEFAMPIDVKLKKK